MKESLDEVKNIVERVYNHAHRFPKQTALIFESGSKLTFEELLTKIQQVRDQLVDNGITKGDRILVLLPMSPQFIFLILALFADNIVPVLIDPRLKKSFWRKYIAEARTKAIISNSKILKLRWVWWWLFRYPLITVDRPTRGCKFIDASIEAPPLSLQFDDLPNTEDTAEILVSLTSGTTGKPKIISRPFSIFKHQQRLSCQYTPKLAVDIHLPLYGIAMLQSIVQGATTVITETQTPERIIQLIEQHKVTRFSGPPGALNTLLEFMEINNIKLPQVQNVLTGGAPIPRWFSKNIMTYFNNAKFHIIYGSTECEPISIKLVTEASLASEDLGFNVGKPIAEIQILRKGFSKSYQKDIFELNIEGPNCVVSSNQTHLVTGDLAYENELGELILVGRKNDVFQNQIAGYIEESLENLPSIKRVALKMAKNSDLLAYIELHQSSLDQRELSKSVHKRINHLLLNFSPKQVKIIFKKKIPVDPRHGWKIQRNLL